MEGNAGGRRTHFTSTELLDTVLSTSNVARTVAGTTPNIVAHTARNSFTFVNQHEDINSVARRSIRNEAHRHEIRSHVMRGVRQLEASHGKKRPTGRPQRNSKTTGKRSTGILPSTSSPESDKGQATTGPLSQGSDEAPLRETVSALERQTIWKIHPKAHYDLRGQPNTHVLDPFDSMPGETLKQETITSLVYYYKNYFVPITFPVEDRRPSGQAKRMALMSETQRHRPVAFLGWMAAISAHQAILCNHTNDLNPFSPSSPFNHGKGNYKSLVRHKAFEQAHHAAIRAQKIALGQRCRLDLETFEACFALITAATIMGNFKEAHTHLKALKAYMESPQGKTSYAIAELFVPLADLKVAVGMLSRPLLTLPWDPKQPIPEPIAQRMISHASHPATHLGKSFPMPPRVTSALYNLTSDAVTLCHLRELGASSVDGLTEEEVNLYRHKSHGLEYQVVGYVYDIFPASHHLSPETNILGEPLVEIPPVEQLIRMALIGILSAIWTVVLPGSGLGRATTWNQVNALRAWLSECPAEERSTEDLELTTWVSFVFAECGRQQSESAYFIETLYFCGWVRLGLRAWEDVERLIKGFLFVWAVQESSWRITWEEVERMATAERKTQDEHAGSTTDVDEDTAGSGTDCRSWTKSSSEGL